MIIYHRDIPHVESPGKVCRSGSRIVLEDVVDGTEISHEIHGKAFLSTTRIASLVDAESVSCEFEKKLADENSGLYFRVSDIHDPGELSVSDNAEGQREFTDVAAVSHQGALPGPVQEFPAAFEQYWINAHSFWRI